MSSENGEVYIMQDDDEQEWVSPTPAQAVIVETVTAETDLENGDLEDLNSYVDADELRGVLDSEEAAEVTFTIESHDVTVDEDGNVTVSS